jgi:hypothetical protein
MSKNNHTQPRQVYYDIQVNNFQSTGSTNQHMQFSETRNQPIIRNSGDYSLSIVRFQLDTYSLPTFIADIEPSPNTDINKMIETITFEYETNGVVTNVKTLNLKWVPSNKHISLPPAPAPLQDAKSEYYYGNSFRQYCDLVNTCLSTLTDQIQVGSSVLSGLFAPYLIWNETTQTCELLAQEVYYNNMRNHHINIYFNRALYGKFSSLPADKNYNGSQGRIYKIILKDDYSTKSFSLYFSGDTQPKAFIKVAQEYSTIANWTPVTSIVFTSNTLPIVQTQLSETLIYSDGNIVNIGIPQNFAPVISDMATNEMCYKPNLLYVPSAQYRMIDMIGNNDISTIDIAVYWKDRKGNLNPFILQSGASVSIKLLFQLKTV